MFLYVCMYVLTQMSKLGTFLYVCMYVLTRMSKLGTCVYVCLCILTRMNKLGTCVYVLTRMSKLSMVVLRQMAQIYKHPNLRP